MRVGGAPLSGREAAGRRTDVGRKEESASEWRRRAMTWALRAGGDGNRADKTSHFVRGMLWGQEWAGMGGCSSRARTTCERGAR